MTNPATTESKRDDPMAVVIQVDPRLEFSMRSNGSQTVYIANDPRTGKFYRFGAREYHAVTLMDGTRTLEAVFKQLDRDGLLWSTIDVVAFARELTQHRLADVIQSPSPQNSAVQQDSPRQPVSKTAKRGIGFATPIRMMAGLLTQRFPLVNGDRVASKLLPVIGFLFSRPAQIAWVMLVVCGFGAVWTNADAFSLEIRRVFDRQLWLVLAVIWCVLKVVHECGHAVCAKRHGVRVGPMGIMFFLFAPIAYVDVTDAWKLVRARDRVQIALAGVYLELAIGAAVGILWWFIPVGFAKHLAAQVFLVAGPATLLVNANPLLRLDGYYVLSDLLEIPNLRAQGRKRLGGFFESALFGLPIPQSALTGWRRDFAVVHAFCSVLFQMIWMSGLVIAISAWAKGLGILVSVVAVLVWAMVPLVRWMHRIWTIQPREGLILSVYQRRLIALCTVVSLAVQYAAFETSPLARRVPVMVRYQNEQIERAPVDAFVTSVFVQCGDRVQRGALLMELDQPELNLQRDQLIDQRDLAIAESIQHRRRGEIALATASEQETQSLERRLLELVDQIDSLRIVAQRDGKITTPATDRLFGSYVSQGDELLRVSDPQEKEVLALVAEDSLDAYNKAAEAGQVAKIRLRGGVTLTATLTELQPSASRSLPHPALAVTAGGPLAVQMLDQSNSNELVYPQLRSVLPLDAMTSMSVNSGQIGRLTIPDNRTLVSRIWDQFQIRQ